MARSVFSVESEDRVESPERLNEYIRVSSPGVWALVAALTLVLVAFIAWGFIGRIPQTVQVKGVVDEPENNFIAVVVDASRLTGKALMGKAVTFRLASGLVGEGTVTDYTTTPRSRPEMSELMDSDFLTSVLVSSDYSYLLGVTAEQDLSQCDNEIADVTIITDEVPPIAFLLR